MNAATYYVAVPVDCGQVRLGDEIIEEILRNAFGPHRCRVRFEATPGESRRAVLSIRVTRLRTYANEKEFVVEGVPVDALRDFEALRTYVNDVRHHLRARGVVFEQQ